VPGVTGFLSSPYVPKQWSVVYLLQFSQSLQEETPVQEHNDDKAQSSNRAILFPPSACTQHVLSQHTHLFQQQFPIYPHRRLPILPTILPQPPAHLPHPLQTIPSVQQILDILRHHLRHICQLAVQLVQITRCAGVAVRLLCPLHEGVEFDEGVGTQGGRGELGRGVGGQEFGGDVGEVGEGEFARVGGVADAEEADVGADEVAGVGGSVSGKTRVRVRAWCGEGRGTGGCMVRFLCLLGARSCG